MQIGSQIPIYTDVSLLEGGAPVTMLAPLLNQTREDSSDPRHGRFKSYYAIAQQLFQLSNKERAKYAVLPFDYGKTLEGQFSQRKAEEFIEDAANHGLKTLVFCWRDSNAVVPFRHTIIYRTAPSKAFRDSEVHILPTWQEDFIHKYFSETFPTRPWKPRPKVSFCGRATHMSDLSWKPKLKRTVREIKRWIFTGERRYPYLQLRTRAMELLHACPDIETDFVIRSGFWGRHRDTSATVSNEERQKVRREYIDNIVNSDYVLVVRGAGNFSMRFFEALCCGRIPLIVDTNSLFPATGDIQILSEFPSVRCKDLRRLPQILLEWHHDKASEFEAELYKARRIWEQWYKPESFFRHLHGRLKALH